MALVSGRRLMVEIKEEWTWSNDFSWIREKNNSTSTSTFDKILYVFIDYDFSSYMLTHGTLECTLVGM